MFLYLNKKIALPNGVKINAISWSKNTEDENGWIACGGDNGVLKILKLEPATELLKRNSKNVETPASGLLVNQALENHKSRVTIVVWNDVENRLTTADESGLIIVWKLHKGGWAEEMINNRNKSVVRDLKWSADGKKICIIYEDGAIIVGSVSGNRLWGKDLSSTLSLAEWSPDGKYLLLGTMQGEVLILDTKTGNYQNSIPILCLTPNELTQMKSSSANVPQLASISWFGKGGSDSTPSLAICYRNGKCQIMKNEQDEKPILLNTGFVIVKAKWSSSGNVLGIAGYEVLMNNVGEKKVINQLQLYSCDGTHIRTLKLVGNMISDFAWECNDLRVAITIDSYIYFANVRQEHRWAYFDKTFLYAYSKSAERNDYALMFWNLKSNEHHVRNIKKLLFIKSFGEHCVVVSRTDSDSNNKISVSLCNSIGTPVDSKSISVEPLYCTMTISHIILANECYLYVWKFKQSEVEDTPKKDTEFILNIEDKNARAYSTFVSQFAMKTDDAICGIGATDTTLLVSRDSGTIHHFALPSLELKSKYSVNCRPNIMQLNCTCTKLAIIDMNGIFSIYEIKRNVLTDKEKAKEFVLEKLALDRKDVCEMIWSDDDEHYFALLEKSKLYVFRGLIAEEPIQSTIYLCKFNRLKITGVFLDDLLINPEALDSKLFTTFGTKSLKDAAQLLSEAGIEEAYTFIKDNSHPRLWKLLAEEALKQLNFSVAHKAFVQFSDYSGIQFVKSLTKIDDKSKQMAEVAVYFKKFEAAEKIYLEMDRRDLAIDLRMKIGDWAGVLSLIEKTDDDELITKTYNNLGNYFADNQKWNLALLNYQKAKNYSKIALCTYKLEDYKGLEKLIDDLPEGSPLLLNIGEKFTTAGISELATKAYLRANEVRLAIDACVQLNQWDQAIVLAEEHNFKEINDLLFKYANHLVEKDLIPEAIELYQKANRHLEALKLVHNLCQKCGKFDPLKAKTLYVFAATEFEKHRLKLIDKQLVGEQTSTMKTLKGLIKQDATFDKALDNIWHGAEAYHFFMLAQRQFQQSKFQEAFVAAARLIYYDDIIPSKQLYSLIALTAYFAKNFFMCSKMFTRLETLGDDVCTAEEREKYRQMAIEIFTENSPKIGSKTNHSCPNCSSSAYEWENHCSTCRLPFYPCVASGKNIFGSSYWICNLCKHRALDNEMFVFKHCPLCHTNTLD